MPEQNLLPILSSYIVFPLTNIYAIEKIIERLYMDINAHTELYCIFGNPVKHSLSPIIHNTAFHKMGINAVYLAFTPHTLHEGIESIKILGIKGASITIPYKIDAMKHVDSLDPLAQLIGSINTINNENGKLVGYNTDGSGAVQSLLDHSIPVKNTKFLIIGNGGSARAIAYTLLEQKGSVIIAGRNSNNIKNLTNELKTRYDNVADMLIHKLDSTCMKTIDVIINTTPVGMHPDVNTTPLRPELLEEQHVVFDIVYAPHRTLFIRDAKKKHCRVIYGIEMLVHQAAEQFKIWTGMNIPADEITNTLKKRIPK